MIVEDHDLVRRLAATMLEKARFEVFAAAAGPEAIDLAQENLQLIDCALIDLTMPGMGGVEVASAIRNLRPSLPIIFMSGYARAPGDFGAVDNHATGFLQKPFTADTLVDSVRAALNS